MATAFANKVEALNADYNDAMHDVDLAVIYRNWAVADYEDENYPLAMSRMLQVQYNFIHAFYEMLTGYWIPAANPYLPQVLRLCWEYDYAEIPPAVVTWKAICEAWIKNDFEGRMPTIACIDRMRQILWDEPFYVRWAARPEEQEL